VSMELVQPSVLKSPRQRQRVLERMLARLSAWAPELDTEWAPKFEQMLARLSAWAAELDTEWAPKFESV
jgi:hypothetical protein